MEGVSPESIRTNVLNKFKTHISSLTKNPPFVPKPCPGWEERLDSLPEWCIINILKEMIRSMVPGRGYTTDIDGLISTMNGFLWEEKKLAYKNNVDPVGM